MNTKSLRNIFLILFVASTAFMFMSFFSSVYNLSTPAGTETPGVVPVSTADPGDISEHPSQAPSESTNSVAVIGSLLTSITSLAGFITTTVITWRKEKREASLADVEHKRLETELEKSRFELEELKKSSKKKDVRKKK